MIAELAPRIAPVLLANLTTRYPYHDAHLVELGDPPHDPLAAHPAFGNSFDWHSSVHSHWTALGVVEFGRRTSGAGRFAALEGAIAANLRTEHLRRETAYLQARPSYERPYGWAWAAMLAVRAPVARELATVVARHALAWLHAMPIPVRHGVHSNTAFALGLLLDASRTLQFDELERAIVRRAEEWFGNDRAWPARWERSGHDFLSPGLAEADLMRRVRDPGAFAAWWNAFVPDAGDDAPLLLPADVPDVADGHIVHLHGLNLSRAGALARIAQALQEPALLHAARRLYAASVDRAVLGHYSETHWLATFAWDAAASIDAASALGAAR